MKKIIIDPKDIDIVLKEICFNSQEYRENKTILNKFLKDGKWNKLSLKLQGFMKQYLKEKEKKK